MSRQRSLGLAFAFAGALSLSLGAGAAAAQGEYSVLGLSAMPDAYVPEVEVDFGHDFELYVILAGPGAVAPLPWQFSSVDWAVLQSCCGGSPAFMVESHLATDSLVHEGDPILGVRTTAPDCFQSDIILIATLTFTWIYQPTGPFYMGAAAMSAVEICGEDTQFLSGCSVRITPLGVTPAGNRSWGEVKTLFR
ncbi:hypothetical protein KKA85_06550 [bacterium]|nr:hypothetical protein [bacterium]MBU1675426.1 hypothetical protein [bacterium]